MPIYYGVQIMDNAFLTAPYSLSAYAYEDLVYQRGDFYGLTIDGELKTPKDAFPDDDNWFRLCYPLPVNKTVEVRIRALAYKSINPRPHDFVKSFVIGDVDEAYLIIHLRDAERGYCSAPSCIYGLRLDEVYVVTYTAPQKRSLSWSKSEERRCSQATSLFFLRNWKRDLAYLSRETGSGIKFPRTRSTSRTGRFSSTVTIELRWCWLCYIAFHDQKCDQSLHTGLGVDWQFKFR